MNDPRPDLTTDAALWERLLTLAQNDDAPEGLYGVLRGCRALGVEIGRYSRGLQLRHGELVSEEYAAILLEWLVPHRDALAALLRKVANERTAA